MAIALTWTADFLWAVYDSLKWNGFHVPWLDRLADWFYGKSLELGSSSRKGP